MRTPLALVLALALTSGWVSPSSSATPTAFALGVPRPTNALVFGTNLSVKHALEDDDVELGNEYNGRPFDRRLPPRWPSLRRKEGPRFN